MAAPASPDIVNRLIAGLPRKDRKQLLMACERVDMVFGQTLCELGQPLRHVHFPLDGIISIFVTVGGHQPLEMGVIGNEGMLGATLALGVNAAPLRAVVQGTGAALRMSAPRFRRELRENPALVRTLDKYLYVLMAQLSQTAACTHFHEVAARLARWLLMMHDRAHADHFHLTHEYLADMLGVRRSGVTTAAGVLQAKGVISYTRGEIRILDRTGLEAMSCECYAAVIEAYARVLG